MMIKRSLLSLVLLFLAGSSVAQANPYSCDCDPCDCWNWTVRFRNLCVCPDESASITPIGGKIAIDDFAVNEVDFTYFFYRNFSLELIAAVSPHRVKAKNTSLGDLDLGSVWLLPPTLLLQYHFMPQCWFSPYLGAGINYTVFFNEKAGPDINNIKYDNSFGVAFQAGADIYIKKNSGINFDVKKIYISPHVSINNQAVKADVDINPWVFGIGAFIRL